MNWFDYTRGYDDGREDYHTSKNNNNLLVTLLQLAFYTATMVIKLCFFILTGSAAFLWAIIKAMAGRRR